MRRRECLGCPSILSQKLTYHRHTTEGGDKCHLGELGDIKIIVNIA